MQILAPTIVFAIWFCPLVVAQNLVTGGEEATLPVPDGDGAWSMRITTSGGFDGRGKGNLTLTSIGELVCSLPGRPCGGAKVSVSALQPLTQLLVSADTSKWVQPANLMLCMDCYITSVTFSRWESGTLRVLRFSWNDVTRSSMPTELVRVTDLAFSLAKD